jgi:hypothetical protein
LPTANVVPAIAARRRYGAACGTRFAKSLWKDARAVAHHALIKEVSHQGEAYMGIPSDRSGKVGYLILWLLGIPIPILLLFFVMRGCT